MDAIVSKQFKMLSRELLRTRSARLMDCRELLSHLTSTTKLEANKARAFNHREALRCKVEQNTLQRLGGIPSMRTDLPVGGLLSTQLLQHIERTTFREARHVVQSLLGMDMAELVHLHASPVANVSQSPLQDPGTVVALAMLARATPAFFKRNTVIATFDVLIQSERIAFKNLLTKANEGCRAGVHDIRMLSADLLQDFELAQQLYDKAMAALADAEGTGVGGSLSPGRDSDGGSYSPGRGAGAPSQPFFFDGMPFDEHAAAAQQQQQQQQYQQYQHENLQLSPRPHPHEAAYGGAGGGGAGGSQHQSPLQIAAAAGLVNPALGLGFPSPQEQAVAAAAAAHHHPSLPTYQSFSHELSASALRMRQIEDMTQKAHLDAAARALSMGSMGGGAGAPSPPQYQGGLSPEAKATIIAAGSLMPGESIASVGLGAASANSPPGGGAGSPGSLGPVSAAHYGVTSQHLFQSVPPANKQAMMLPVSERQMMALALPGEGGSTILSADGETFPAGTRQYYSDGSGGGSYYDGNDGYGADDGSAMQERIDGLEERVTRIMRGISRGATSRVSAQGIDVASAAISPSSSSTSPQAARMMQQHPQSAAGQAFAASAASIHAAFSAGQSSPPQHQFSGGRGAASASSAASSERYTEDFEDEQSRRSTANTGGNNSNNLSNVARSRGTVMTTANFNRSLGATAGAASSGFASPIGRGGSLSSGSALSEEHSYLDGASVPPPSTAGDASPNRLSRLGTRSKAQRGQGSNSNNNAGAADLDQPPTAASVVSLASDRLLGGANDFGQAGHHNHNNSSSIGTSSSVGGTGAGGSSMMSPSSGATSLRLGTSDSTHSARGQFSGGGGFGSPALSSPSSYGYNYGSSLSSRPDTQDTYAPTYANKRKQQEQQQQQQQQQLQAQELQHEQQQQHQQPAIMGSSTSPSAVKAMTAEQLQHALSGPDGDAVAKKMIKEAMSAATAANAKTAGESLAHLRLFGPKTDAGEIRRRNDSWDEALAARQAHPWLLRLAKLCCGIKILRAYRMFKVRRGCKALRLIAAERGLHPADYITAKMVSNHEKMQSREYSDAEKAEMALSGSPQAVSMRRQEGERDRRTKATVRLQAFANCIPAMKARIHLRQVSRHKCRRKAKAAMRAELGLDTGMLAPQLEAMMGLIQQAGTVQGRMEKAVAAVVSEASREAETHARVRRQTVMDTALSADWLTLPRPEDPRTALCYINVRSGRRVTEHPNTVPANKAAKAAADEIMKDADEKVVELQRQAEHSRQGIAKQQLDTGNALYRLRLLALTMDDEAGGMGLGREEVNKGASTSPGGGVKFPLGIFPLPRGIGTHNVMSLGMPLSPTGGAGGGAGAGFGFAAGSMIGPDGMHMPPTGLDAGLSSSSMMSFGLDAGGSTYMTGSVLGSPGGGMTAVERLRMDIRKQTAALMARSVEFSGGSIDFDEDGHATKSALAAVRTTEKQARKAAKGK